MKILVLELVRFDAMTHRKMVCVWMFQCLVCSVVNLSSWEPETACDLLPKTKQLRCCHHSPELTTSSPNLAFRPTLIDIGDTPMHIDLIRAKLAAALSPLLADPIQLQLISWSEPNLAWTKPYYRTGERRVDGEHMGPVRNHCSYPPATLPWAVWLLHWRLICDVCFIAPSSYYFCLAIKHHNGVYGMWWI